MADRRRRLRRRAATRVAVGVAALAVLVAAGLGVAPERSTAHLNISKYTYSACKGGKVKADDFIDPIGIVFYGKKATSGRIMRLTEKYVDGMKADLEDKSQKLVSHRRCISTRRGVDDHCGLCDRLHIRLAAQTVKKKLHRDKKRRFITVGTPHDADKDVIGCGETPVPTPKHIIPKNGFRNARIKIAKAFKSSGHKVTQKRWKNTRSREQCDGENVDAQGDGIVAFVRVN